MQQRLRLSANIVTGILLAWFLFLPVHVQALGFGNINMKSALNEPLNAEIELLSATQDDIKNLEVKLASREAFLRAGVDRSAILSRIKFDIVKRGGKYYVTLTTQESVREPFLNFLLEMNWKSGRMLREYTMLLDPPDRVQRQQVASAPELTPAEVEPAPAPIPEPAPLAAAEQPLAPEPAPVPAPEPARVESPFLDAPAPKAAATDELYPAIPLDQPAQVPVKTAEAPAPEPVALVPEPVSAPEPIAMAPEPMPLEPAPEPVEAPPAEALASKEKTFESADGGLFPQIPLRAYKESDLAAAGAPAPAPVPEPAIGAEPYQPVGELDYGITKKGDTAWKVAEKLRPSEEISLYQIMMALQQSNPSAFVDGNIHRLKEGQVLRIDDPSLLTTMSKEQAAQQYQSQTQAWEEYLTNVGAAVPRQAIVAGEQIPAETGGVPSGELTLATPSADEMAAGTGSASTAGAVDSDVLRAQVRQAMREAEQERSRNTQLTAKLNELEAELRRLENLVNIKDSDLAALQRKLQEMNAQRATGGAEVATAEPAPAPVREEPVVEPTPEPVAPQPEAIMAPEPAPEPSATEQDIAAATQAEPAVIEPAPVEPAQPTPPDSVMEPVAPVAPSAAPTAPGGGIMDTISGMLGSVSGMLAGLGGMTMMIIIGVVAVVVILLVFIMIRRKRGIHFQESILNAGAAEANAGAVQMDITPSQGSSLMGGESSFLSDFAISGVSAIQAEDSEVDPLTEADVFMAYGRYEAAEERLQEAINQDPDRGELRVKLLELYNTTKNKNSFESAAEDFYAALGDGAGGNPLWQKVVAMGKQIAPGNPLFRGKVAAGVEVPQHDTANLNQADVMDIGLDTGVFSNSEFNPIESTGHAQASTPGGDLDFNLDMATGTEDASAAEDDLDFSLGGSSKASDLDFSLDMDTDTSDDETLQSISNKDTGLDFNLETEIEPEQSEPVADDSMEFSLESSAGDEPTATDIKLDMGKSSAELDFDLDLDEDTAPEIGMDMNLDAGDAMLDLGDAGDEVGTKLDLARAYIDMGDPDGARSILDEVMAEGNPGQKQEAQQLMSQIG